MSPDSPSLPGKSHRHSRAEGIVQVVDSVCVRIPQLHGQGCSEKFRENLLKYDLVKDLQKKPPDHADGTAAPVPTVLASLAGPPLTDTKERSNILRSVLCPRLAEKQDFPGSLTLV